MCTSRFSSAYDLDCHFSYYHSTIKRFKCFHCNRVLYNYSGKLRHERLCSLKSVIKKVPYSQAAVFQKAIPHPEGIIQAEPGHELVKKFSNDEECTTIQNHPVSINLISQSRFYTPKTVPENIQKLIPASKTEQRKTFHICDIMHDIPGFS